MKKQHLLALVSIVSILASSHAIAGVESTIGDIKTNLTTENKTEPNKQSYTLTAPNGTPSNLDNVAESDYANYAATSTADGTNVKLNNTVTLNIAQGSTSRTDYTYLTKDNTGNTSYVAGNTAVTDLTKDFTNSRITTPLTITTANAQAPLINMGGTGTSATYHTTDGSFYLTRNAEGTLLLNNSASTTTDNPTIFNELSALYNSDKNEIEGIYTNLVNYKTFNTTNYDSVGTTATGDTNLISDILTNKGTYSTANTKYNSDLGQYNSYNGSVANTIDNSIATGDATTLASAKTYADTGDATTLASAKTYADTGDATLQANIDAEATARAAGDALTLNAANAYTDKKIDNLDKDLSAGIAAATALSAVEVSNVEKGEVSFGTGYGLYNGESAGAFGAAMGITNNWSVNVGAGISSSDTAFRAGTNYKFKMF